MKHPKHILAILLALALAAATGSAPALAADYTAFSTEELAAMRGTMWGATTEERDAFRSEWQNRVSSMNTEERREHMGNQGNGLRDGSGPRGSMGMGAARGGGMGRGRR